MKKTLFNISLMASIILIGQSVLAQKTGVGGSVIYNLQTRSFGIGARAEYPIEQITLLEGLSLAPQIAYYPSFNNIHEFFIGTSVHLGVYTFKQWKVYGLTNISYNGWINHKDSGIENAKFSNLGFELGGGITSTNCIRPFFEYRYNVKWKEANLRLGLIYTLKCDKRGQVPCPKIPDPPKM
jgi:hypothetical protein